MSNDREIKDIITQLNRLQLQQAVLIARLNERVDETDVTEPSPTAIAAVTAPTANTVRAFAIGDRVTILNPRRLQANKGKIIRITQSRITVQARNGTTIIRAPKNLILENE
jgi:hypothetical protein